jgi:two-component system chemotaxis sensor kinase CheA
LKKEIDLAKYTKLFVSESREYMRTLNETMMELEGDPENRDLVDKMFRACHTVKGMAGMMNLKAVGDLTHALEDVLSALRDGRILLDDSMTEMIFSALDVLDGMIVEVERGNVVEEREDMIGTLKEALTAERRTTPKPKSKKRAKAEDEKKSSGAETVEIRFSKRCAYPSARALVIVKELDKASEVLSTSPTEEEIEQEHVFEKLVVELAGGEHLEEALRRIGSMLDVDEVLVGSADTPRDKWRRLEKDRALPGRVAKEAPLVQTVKVSMDKLDDLLDDVGELVIARSRLVEKASNQDDSHMHEISDQIDKLTSEIQSKVLGIRMIPMEFVMGRFPRLARDTAKTQGKEVELIIDGGSIELDRTVVDRIADPIMHIIRNCVDHGIESVEERESVGKRPKGLIRIVASKQQDHVLIEVSDDGRGIDFDRLRETAVSRGVMTREQANAALGRDLLGLLFRPGFSTKEAVTDVSGRGVGMDIVKRSVEELGGTVMVNTSKGAGTTISLWLPFTLAIIDAMLVSIAGQIYAVAMGVVAESHRYRVDEIKLIRNREVVQLRGEVLPLIWMRDFFGIPRSESVDEISVLVVQSRERRAAIAVDDLMGHQQIVVKALDRRLRRTKGISGGTILGSGNIALILDVDSILGE